MLAEAYWRFLTTNRMTPDDFRKIMFMPSYNRPSTNYPSDGVRYYNQRESEHVPVRQPMREYEPLDGPRDQGGPSGVVKDKIDDVLTDDEDPPGTPYDRIKHARLTLERA